MQFDSFYHTVQKLKFKRIIIIFGFGRLILFSMITLYSEAFREDPDIITQKMNSTPSSAINFGNLQISNQNNWSKYPELAYGKGIYSDPYIIDGDTFDANLNEFALNISNTQDYMRIQNCIFNNSQNKEYGTITIESSANIEIISCRITNNDQTGINIRNSKNISVSQNLIHDNTLRGISCSNSSNLTIELNEIWATDGIGILIESDSHHIDIFNNEIGYNEVGIKIMSFSTYINVTQNSFDHNRNHPVILVQSSFNSIVGNYLYENGENEILDESNDETNTISDNEITYPLNRFVLAEDYMTIVQYAVIGCIFITALVINNRRRKLRNQSVHTQQVEENPKIEYCDHCGKKISSILWNELQNSLKSIYCENCGEKIL